MDCGVENLVVDSQMNEKQGQGHFNADAQQKIVNKNASEKQSHSNDAAYDMNTMDKHGNEKNIQSVPLKIPLIANNLTGGQDTQQTTPRNNNNNHINLENQRQFISYKALKAVMKEKQIKSAQNTPKNRVAVIANLSDFNASVDQQQQQDNIILESPAVTLQTIHSQQLICSSNNLSEKYHLQKSQEMRLKSDQIARELDQIQQKVRSDSAIFAQWKKSQEDSLPSSSTSFQANSVEQPPLTATTVAGVGVGVGGILLPLVLDSPYHYSQGQPDLLSERTFNKKTKKQPQFSQTPQSSSQTEEYFNKETQQQLAGVAQPSLFSNTGKTSIHSIFLSERLKEELKSTRIADHFMQDKKTKERYQHNNNTHKLLLNHQDKFQKDSMQAQSKSEQNIPISAPLSCQNIPDIIENKLSTRHSLSLIDNGHTKITQECIQNHQDVSGILSSSPQLQENNNMLLAPQQSVQQQQTQLSKINLKQEQQNDSQTCLAMIRQNIQEISDAFDKYSKRSASTHRDSSTNERGQQEMKKEVEGRMYEEQLLQQDIVKICPSSQKNQKLQMILNNNKNNKSCTTVMSKLTIPGRQSPNNRSAAPGRESGYNTDRLLDVATHKKDNQGITRITGTERSPSNENTTATTRSSSAHKSILRQTALDAKLRMERVAKRQVHALEKLELSRQASRSPKKDSSSQLITPRNNQKIIPGGTAAAGVGVGVGGGGVTGILREREGIAYKQATHNLFLMSARNHHETTKGMNCQQRRGSSPMSRIEDTQNEFFALKVEGLTTPRTTTATSKGSNKSYHFTGVAGNVERNHSRNKQNCNTHMLSSSKNNNTNSIYCNTNNISSEKVVNPIRTDKAAKNMQILVIPAGNQNSKSYHHLNDLQGQQQHYQENNIICPTLLTSRTSTHTPNSHNKDRKNCQLQLEDSPAQKNNKSYFKHTDITHTTTTTAKSISQTAMFNSQSTAAGSPPSQQCIASPQQGITTPRVISNHSQEYLIASKTPKTSTYSQNINSNQFFSSVKAKSNSNYISSSKLNSNQIARIIDSKGIKCSNTIITGDNNNTKDNSQKLRDAVTKAIEKSMGLKITDIQEKLKEKEKEEGIENQFAHVNRQHKGEAALNGGIAVIMQKYQPIERNAQVVDYGNESKINKNSETNRITRIVNEKQKELMRAMYYRREESMEEKKSAGIQQGYGLLDKNEVDGIKRKDGGQEQEQRQFVKRLEVVEGVGNPINIISPNCQEQYSQQQAANYYQPFKVKQAKQSNKDNHCVKEFSFQKQ